MDAKRIVIEEALRAGVNPDVALSLWKQESAQSTDLTMRGPVLPKGKWAGHYARGPWQIMSFHGPIPEDFRGQTQWAMKHLKERGLRGYYGTGSPVVEGHPTTDQYVAQVMGRVGKPVDVRMAGTDDEIPREMQVAGDPGTGMAMVPVTDQAMLEELDSAFAAPTQAPTIPGLKPVQDPALLAELEAAFSGAEQAGPLVDPPRLSVAGSVGDTLSDAAVGAGMGGTMGWMDELGGLAARAFAPRGMDPGFAQDAMQAAIRGRYRQAKVRSPVATTVGEIGGGAAVGTAIPGGTLTNLGRMATIGGAEGLAAGMGYSDGDLADRAVGGVVSAGIGAVGAPVVAGAIKGLGVLGSGIRRSVLSRPRADGEALIRQALDADMIDAQQARQLLSELGPEGMPADLGPNTQGLARLTANMPGRGKATMTNALEARQAGQTQRVASAAGIGLAPRANETWSDLLTRIIAERRAQAGPLYETAMNARVQLTPVMQAVFGTSSGRRAVQRASRSLQDKITLGEIERIGYDAQTGQVTMRFLDAVKKQLGSMEAESMRPGVLGTPVPTEATRDIGNIRRMFTRHIDDMGNMPEARALGDQNPFVAYAQARSVYAGSEQLREAGNLGAELLQGKKFARNIRPQVAEFTDSEMEVFRLGVLQSVNDVIDSSVSGETTTLARNTADVARKLTRDQRTRDLIRLGFRGRDPEMDRFFRQLDAESRMKDTANAALTGSRTAPMLADREGAEQTVSATSHVMGALQGQYGPAVAAVVRFFANQPKLTPQVMAHVANVLTDSRITDRQLAALAGGVQSARAQMSQSAQGAIAGATGVGAGVSIEYATRPADSTTSYQGQKP